jgi:predicted dehydrogenase
MKKKLRVAMVGYQFMGRAHSNAWRQVARFFDTPFDPVMQVICGRDAEKVGQAARTLGWQEAATSWEEVVRRPDIDVVDICTPGDLHRPIAIAAAAAGKAILCEKPLARNLAEAEEMLAAVRRAGVIHMLCHNYRRIPAVALARQLIAGEGDDPGGQNGGPNGDNVGGKIGKIFHFRGVYLHDRGVDPKAPRTWRHDKARAGSGALGDLGSHMIDLARFLVGEIAEVSGTLQTFIRERPVAGSGAMAPVDVDDAALALLRFQNGAVGSLEVSRFGMGHKNFNHLEINGSRGSLIFNLERLNELQLYVEEGPNSGFRTILATHREHPYIAAWWPPGHLIGYEHTFTHTVLDLMKAIASGQPPAPNFEDGVRAHRVLDAIERASAARTWERVAQDHGDRGDRGGGDDDGGGAGGPTGQREART